MNNQTFEHKLENMKKLNPSLPQHEKKVRFAYVNAKKSAWWGVVLIILPVLFVGYNVTKHVMGLSFLPDIDTFFPGQTGDVILNSFLPFVFLGGGLFAIILNLMAVLHIETENMNRSWNLTISVRKEKWNFIILAVAFVSLGILVLYVLIESL